MSLRSQELHLVARATTVASLQCASPAWLGYATKEQRNRLEHLLKGLRRCGLLPADFPSFEALATEADLKLFKSISSNSFHVLWHYLRQREPTGYGLRPRTHSFALPAKNDRNFVTRLLYGVLTHPN